MRTLTEPIPKQEPASAEQERRAKAARRAAEVLLRDHPDAMIFAQAPDGLVVPVPRSLGLESFPVLATDWRTGGDLCVAEDRMTIVNAWMELKREGVAEARARMRSDPTQWWVVRMLDLRNTHGVVLSVVWPTSEQTPETAKTTVQEPASTTPRFGTRKQDEEGNVIDCDPAYLQMFGYSEEDVIGQPTFERVHSEDQARLIESWIAMIATGRVQMARVRMRRNDGGWLWVDTTYHNYLSDPDHGHVLAECIDVSAEMAAQEALQDREELLRRLIEEMPDGLLQLDSERNVVYHNARLLDVLHVSTQATDASADGAADTSGAGVAAADTSGDADDTSGDADDTSADAGADTSADAADAAETEPHLPREPETLALAALTRILTDEARAAFDGVIERALREGVSDDVEVEAALAFGERRQILMKVRPLLRDSGVVTGVIASAQDVTDSARARRELEQRATFDALTGAHNRSSIIAALAAELDASADTGVIYVDLDRFKAVNDTFGHPAGDAVLAQVAERLKAAMRSSDELGRLGGDEFLILLRGARGNAVAMDAAERISQALRGTCELSGGSFELCASVGVACVGDSQVSAEELIEQADRAMYSSKKQRCGVPVLAPEERLPQPLDRRTADVPASASRRAATPRHGGLPLNAV